MDMHRVAEIIKGTGPAGPKRPALRLRQTTVVTVNEGGTVDVTFADGEQVIEGVVHFSDVTPVEGGSLWVLTDGVDVIGIGVT